MPSDRQIVLVLPAERDLCPYVELYLNLLNQQEKPYLIIQWDRLGRIGPNKHRYSSRKKAAQMGFFDYLGYGFFVKGILRMENPEAVVVFGFPLLLALKLTGALSRRYYGVDVRDFHLTYNIPVAKWALQKANFCAASSPGFAAWLPPDLDYVISHNCGRLPGERLQSVGALDARFNQKTHRIVVGTIGQLKDLGANQKLLHNLGNNNGYELHYHGEGVIESDLQEMCRTHKYLNVKFTGRYNPSDEKALYGQCDIISMLMTAGSLNNDTLLANRVYNSMLYGVPQLVFEGSYLAEVVVKFNLGIVISDPNQLPALDTLLDDFYQDLMKFQSGRLRFQKWVESHQQQFEEGLVRFVSQSPLRLDPFYES